jgi:putative N6-adenine-specific DNA methylase
VQRSRASGTRFGYPFGMPPAKQLPPREIVAICPPGLEAIVAAELIQLGWPTPRQGTGVVTAVVDAAQLYRACLHCRTATDLRVRVGRASAGSLDGLAQGLSKLPWSLFVQPGQPTEVSISVRGSAGKRKDMLARKAEHAIRDAVRGPMVTHRPGARGRDPVPVHLRFEGGRVEASVDPVGDSLWKRGYRSRGGAAPLRENIAAAALQALGWRSPMPLVDPFCGSGTLLIEAATMAAGLAPATGRSFAFERWPCHAQRLWRQVQAAPSPHAGTARGPIMGADADEKVLTLARDNVGWVKVGQAVRWAHQRVDAMVPPPGGPGLVLSNPPWGNRLGEQVGGVYAALGQALRDRFAGWEVALFCPDRALIRAVRMPMEPRLGFAHGGARLTLWVGRVPGRPSDQP